jgi:hypothetical protein
LETVEALHEPAIRALNYRNPWPRGPGGIETQLRILVVAASHAKPPELFEVVKKGRKAKNRPQAVANAVALHFFHLTGEMPTRITDGGVSGPFVYLLKEVYEALGVVAARITMQKRQSKRWRNIEQKTAISSIGIPCAFLRYGRIGSPPQGGKANGRIAEEVSQMNWQYTRRSDGLIAITLDNNVWDFLFARKIKLDAELPPGEFVIFITREVEIESLAIPADTEAKTMLKDYIDRTIAQCGIKTTTVFGFATDGPGPQRMGGFGQGAWQSQTEREFYDAVRQQYLFGRRETNSQLTQNEADAAVAAQSFFSIALTCEKPGKSGPLRFAAEHGGKVLYLPDIDRSGLTLKAYIAAFHGV